MDWKRLVLYPTADCLKHSPVCPQEHEMQAELGFTFFREVLEQARQIPEWRFVLNCVGANTLTNMEQLIKYAWSLSHDYSLVLPYEHLYCLNSEILQKSQQIMVCLDEYTVPETQIPLFFNSLDWIRAKGVSPEIMLTLTEHMIGKLLDSFMLDRLIGICHKLHFVVPKGMLENFMTRDRFSELLDLLVVKMQRPSFVAKIELDPCLMPVLMPEPLTQYPVCAFQGVCHVLPDGNIKICPYGPAFWKVATSQEFSAFIHTQIDSRIMKPLHACVWRQTWNAQEESGVYVVGS